MKNSHICARKWPFCVDSAVKKTFIHSFISFGGKLSMTFPLLLLLDSLVPNSLLVWTDFEDLRLNYQITSTYFKGMGQSNFTSSKDNMYWWKAFHDLSFAAPIKFPCTKQSVSLNRLWRPETTSCLVLVKGCHYVPLHKYSTSAGMGISTILLSIWPEHTSAGLLVTVSVHIANLYISAVWKP